MQENVFPRVYLQNEIWIRFAKAKIKKKKADEEEDFDNLLQIRECHLGSKMRSSKTRKRKRLIELVVSKSMKQ